MKLTNRTTPQARNYQCNKCKHVTYHANMYDDEICNSCKDDEENDLNLKEKHDNGNSK